MRAAVCLVVRNEGRHIAEWLAWHHLAGFDTAIVFDHQSTDATAEVVRQAGRRQDVRLHPWGWSGGSHRDSFQTTAYLRACQIYGNEFDWLLCLDADEFFVLHQGTLTEFLSRFSGADQVAVPWAIFGSNGHSEAPDRLIIEDYTRRSGADFLPNRHVKTFARPLAVRDWPNPHTAYTPGATRDPAGQPILWDVCPGVSARDPSYAVCQVNHYMTRSRKHWELRMARASASSPSRTWEEFDAYDRNEVEDRCATDRASGVRQYMQDNVVPTGQGLVMDLGVSEGNDTSYYLAKGFQVISVEADPETCTQLRRRFEQEIASGQLTLLNFAASDSFGVPLEIFVHKDHQPVSGTRKRDELNDNYASYFVPTIDWRTLVAQAGTPRYLKIDIEGSEAPFLRSMLRVKALPEFISVECYKFEPIELLHEMGYRRFKLVDQNPPGGFQLPARQMEGLPVNEAAFVHSSGPFGLDVFGSGDWLDFDALQQAWPASVSELHRTWFDCHAWKPN